MQANKKTYDEEKRKKAVTALSLRGVVAVYLVYLAFNLAKGVTAGGTTMPLPVGLGLAAAFLAAAVGFLVYALLQFRKQLSAAAQDNPPVDTAVQPAEKDDVQ